MTPLDLTLLIFVFLLGACVGSFLNVVIYRLPAGESLVFPPSHCPHCNYRLAWYDNVPILAWLWLRAKCRKCGAPISIQYPLIELLTALLFAGAYVLFYLSGMWREFSTPGVIPTWPILAVYLVLVAGLLAATIIDARYYIIPLEIPWLITVVALVGLPLGGWWLEHATQSWGLDVWKFRLPLPVISSQWTIASIGGAAGLAAANLLLYAGLIPRSFDEFVYDENPQVDEADVFLPHPRPRIEMLKELLFLALPAAGAIGGWCLGAGAHVEPIGRVIGGVLLGYLGGGLVVWATRLLGTLAFGKEAMGLGDVHLMAAVGAAAGWQTAVLAFFIAPFLGLAWALGSAGAQKLLNRQVRVIPYGPHLAIASVLVIVFHEQLMMRFGALLGQ